MKNLMKLIGIIALTAIIGFGFTACGGDDDDPPPPKVIASMYRFENGEWYPGNSGNVQSGTVTVGENLITFSGETADLTGVYTQGGGNADWGDPVTWAYLYDNSGKIGLIALFTSGASQGDIELILGKTRCTNTAGITAIATVTDMQDTVNGAGIYE